MRIKKPIRLLILPLTILLVLNYSTTSGAQGKVENGQQRETLSIPIGVYILDDAGNSDTLSSQRQIEGFQQLFRKVNDIWSQADIRFETDDIERVTVPPKALSAVTHRIGRGGIREFFKAIRRGHMKFDATDNRALMWGFYVRRLGGPNGIAPLGSRVFFVADNTTVHDARVTSHEIGHVLGLYHARDDQDRLLYSGTNGMILTREEQQVARYSAKRILQK